MGMSRLWVAVRGVCTGVALPWLVAITGEGSSDTNLLAVPVDNGVTTALPGRKNNNLVIVLPVKFQKVKNERMQLLLAGLRPI